MNVLLAALAALLMLQNAPATGSISGTVFRAGSNLQGPLDSARVELSGGPLPLLVVRTDSKGRFAFQALPPGGYQMRVSKDGYIRQEYAKRAAIVIKPDVSHKSVVVELERAPTMAGRVLNEYGEPIGNILVQALKAVYGPQGDRMFKVLAGTLTDDHGDYRLYWLDPGDYVINAAFVPPVRTPGNPIDLVERVVYAPTYYPIASDLANAQRIPLKADQNILALDFRLIRSPAVTVRGSISTASSIKGAGRAPSTTVTLTLAGDTTNATRYAAKSNDLGDFEFRNVAPGDYIASAETMVGMQHYAANTHVVVRVRDENSVNLVMTPGVEVVGRIVLNGTPSMDWSAAHVSLSSVDPHMDSFTALRVQEDGQFPIWNVQPGTYSIQVEGIPEDLYIKAERSGQSDLPDALLNISRESPEPLEIVLGADGGRMEGTVTDHSGQPFSGARVVLVPNAERRSRIDQYRVTSSNEDGKFEIRGIPPGEYQLIAWGNVEDNAWLSSEFMANFLNPASQFTVPASTIGTVQLPLSPDKP